MTTLLVALVLALWFGAGQASAEEGGGAAQTAGQSATSGQSAGGAGGAYQSGASNGATSIRVLSPGDSGAVTQSNTTTAGALAANGNTTSQDTAQTQAGGWPGSSHTQIAGQAAENEQSADATATAVQLAPSNDATSIRVLSPGNGGNLTQSNSATAGAAALNGNETQQSTDQSQGGSGPGSGTQVAGQEASNHQDADANAAALQVKPSNTASSIRVLSPGDDGDVSQSNDATAVGIAANGNKTQQSIDQAQGGAAAPAPVAAPAPDAMSGYGSNGTQVAGQEASNHQDADANAAAIQVKPSNTASSIRVLSPGDGGNVSQSNSTTALAAGLNGNKTVQSIDQSQGGSPAAPAVDGTSKGEEKKPGHGSSSTQIAGQEASNHQDADANAAALQVKPSNTASSIRVLSPGDDGDVSQSNDATAVGIAANGNKTHQSIDQAQAGSGPGSSSTQVAGQKASSHQDADANALAIQLKPTNTASSIRVLSPGDGGNVSQSNSTTALAAGLNGNKTVQSIDQSQGGSPAPSTVGERSIGEKTGHGSEATQVAGQESSSHQDAEANALAFQVKPRNDSSSIRVLSPGDDGSVTQSNDAAAVAAALNGNKTGQWIGQSQAGGGPGGSSLQVAGQGSWSRQDADAGAAAAQLGAKNEIAPVRVGSPGGGGSVEQSNRVGALALALNLSETCQLLLQEQAGHGSGSLQVAGQGSWEDQRGGAWTRAIQGKGHDKKRR